MSILYGTGAHRLVYKAASFATGKTVAAYLWSPATPPVKSALQTFTEVSDGLYYLDYTFAAVGTHFGEFYEGGTATTVGTFRVCATPPTANEVADAVLIRNVSNVEATAGEHTLCTLVLAGLESAVSGTTWTIKRTNGSTTHATKTVTVDASADPITAVE